jgi:hypothetical protein
MDRMNTTQSGWQSSEREWKSPARKLAAFFQRSRDGWKHRSTHLARIGKPDERSNREGVLNLGPEFVISIAKRSLGL